MWLRRELRQNVIRNQSSVNHSHVYFARVMVVRLYLFQTCYILPSATRWILTSKNDLKTSVMADEANLDDFILENFDAFIAIVPKESDNYTTLISHCAVLRIKKYWRWGRAEDLEEAINRAREAVAATPDDHQNLAAMLNNLGNMLGSRYERTGKMEDLEEAIKRARQALAVTPEDHSDRAGRLSNLGNKLERRYERTGKMEDLEEAVERARKAVATISHDHPDRAAMLSNLGNKLKKWSIVEVMSQSRDGITI
jgi:tetratricopeptide (TPR) repeat protein